MADDQAIQPTPCPAWCTITDHRGLGDWHRGKPLDLEGPDSDYGHLFLSDHPDADPERDLLFVIVRTGEDGFTEEAMTLTAGDVAQMNVVVGRAMGWFA